MGEFLACSCESRRRGAEAVNPVRAGGAPRSSRGRPGLPNWIEKKNFFLKQQQPEEAEQEERREKRQENEDPNAVQPP